LYNYNIKLLSERIKEERIKNNYTQERLAELCSVSRQAVTNWELGKSVPDLSSIILLAGLFKISVDSLLGLESSKKCNAACGCLSRGCLSRVSLDRSNLNHKHFTTGMLGALREVDEEICINKYLEFMANYIGANRICLYEYNHCTNEYQNTYQCKVGCLADTHKDVNDIKPCYIEQMKDKIVDSGYIYIADINDYFNKNTFAKRTFNEKGLNSLVLTSFLNENALLRIDNVPITSIHETNDFLEISINFIETILKRKNVGRRPQCK